MVGNFLLVFRRSFRLPLKRLTRTISTFSVHFYKSTVFKFFQNNKIKMFLHFFSKTHIEFHWNIQYARSLRRRVSYEKQKKTKKQNSILYAGHTLYGNNKRERFFFLHTKIIEFGLKTNGFRAVPELLIHFSDFTKRVEHFTFGTDEFFFHLHIIRII